MTLLCLDSSEAQPVSLVAQQIHLPASFIFAFQLPPF